MNLPDNEHPGWQRLLAAVLEDQPTDTTAPGDAPTAVGGDEDALVLRLPDAEDRVEA